MIDRLLELIGKIPTTQAQFVVAAMLWLGTGGRYLTSTTWVPAYEWLAALLLLTGVSTAQFVAKRTTDHAYVAAKKGTP